MDIHKIMDYLCKSIADTERELEGATPENETMAQMHMFHYKEYLKSAHGALEVANWHLQWALEANE